MAAARLEGPTDVFSRQRLDIALLARETTTAISALAREKQIEVSVHVPEAAPYVMGDSTQLRLALIGLLDNAVKYNRHRGSIEVVVAADGGWVEIAVSDTGDGLTEKESPHVFERFFRGENARGFSIEGAGLGLTITRQVAQAHDGDVTLSTKPGEGTTITLRLPALQS